MQVFSKGVDKVTVVLMSARASRIENQDAIDGAIASMLSDPKQVYIIHSYMLLSARLFDIYIHEAELLGKFAKSGN